MKILSSFETKNISAGIATLSIQGSEINVILSSSSDSFGFMDPGIGNLQLKGDGVAFSNGNYIETSAIPRKIYTLDKYFMISTTNSTAGCNYHIVIL